MKYISTIEMGHEAWLERRKKGIGGSDAACIIGLNPYRSAYAVWADKLNMLPEQGDNEAMRCGRDLEAYVAQRWCEATGKRVRRRNAILVNPNYPFAFANVDRLVVGENAGLECKTARYEFDSFSEDLPPNHYYVQCMHYMAVTGAERWYLGILVLGKGFFRFTIERNEDEINALMEAEKQFWINNVLEEIPPDVDGSNSTSDTLKKIYSLSNSDEMIELEDFDEDLLTYLDLKASENALQKKLLLIQQKIQNEMKEAEIGIAKDYKVKWKRQERKSFDKDRFETDCPDLYKQYLKTSTSRRFSVEEKEIEI